MAKQTAFGKGHIKEVERGKKYRIELSGGSDPRTGIVYHVTNDEALPGVERCAADEIPGNACAVELVEGKKGPEFRRVRPALKFRDATDEQKVAMHWQTPVVYLRARETFNGTKRGAELRVEQMRRELKLLRELLTIRVDPGELQAFGLSIGQAAADGLDAVKLAKELQARKDERARAVSFADYLERYLTNREKMGELRDNTLAKDRTESAHLLRHFGGMKLPKMTPGVVRGAYADMRANGMGDETLKAVHGLLKRCIRDAYENDVLTVNFMDKVKMPERTTAIKRGMLEPDEASRLVDVITHNPLTGYTVTVYLGLGLGARLGEILGLTWSHVELKGQRPYVFIIQQHTRKQKQAPLKTDKNGQPEGRVVPIDSATVAVLKAWKATQRRELNALGVEQGGGTPVITNEVGNWVTHSNFERWFRTFNVRNGYARWFAEDGREIVELEAGDPLAGLYDDASYLILWHDSEGWACDAAGKRYSRTNPNPYKKLKRSYDGLRFHWLRHTHFSHRLAAGDDIVTCQALGGWKDARVLMNVYAHPLSEKVWASAGFMDKLTKAGVTA